MGEDQELAYFAGIIDGEGHFYRPISKNGNGREYYQSRVLFIQSEKNNGLEMCEWALRRYGGYISFSKQNRCYRWQLSGLKAEELARKIRPFLISKKEQVKRILPECKNIDCPT